MNNQYLGEVTLIMGGKSYILVYNWRALGKLKTSYTDSDLDDITSGRNVGVIANVLSIGLEKYHPDMTSDKIMELSPPFIAS